MAYKPWVAKYQIQILAEVPLPDFLERKDFFSAIHDKLSSVGRVNFVAVGSSATSNIGEDYYSQNFHDINHYQKALDKNKLPTLRGLKLNQRNNTRQHVAVRFKLNLY